MVSSKNYRALSDIVDLETSLAKLNYKNKSVFLENISESLSEDTPYRISEDDLIREAEDGKDKKIPIKTLLKLQEEIEKKFNMLDLGNIDASNGDLRNLPNKVYARVFSPISDNVSDIVVATTGSKSEFIGVYNDLLKVINKHKPNFTKAYRKKNGTLTKMVYRAGVLYLAEMASIITNTVVTTYDDSRANFDKGIANVKDYANIFAYGRVLAETISDKLFREELKITESGNLNLHPSLTEINICESNMSIATASKLINYGLSNTIYNLFAVFRFIIYLCYYRKYTIQNKLDLILRNIDVLETTEKSGSSEVEEAVKEAGKFKVDTIEGSAKASTEINKGETIDIDF